MRDVQQRAIWLLGITTAGMLLMSAQLYRLTIAETASWRIQAESQIRREMPSHGPRGAIFDRKGRSLATSEPAFAAVLIKNDIAHVEQIMPKLSVLLAGGDPVKAEALLTMVRRRVTEHQSAGRQYEPITIARKLDQQVVSVLVERRAEFPGVLVVTEAVRYYPHGLVAGPLLGYVGAVSEEQLDETTFKDYQGDEVVGKNGLELFYERELRGKPGHRSVVVDPYGRPMSEIQETPSVPGANLHLTLDLDLQTTAEAALRQQMEWIRQQRDPEANPIRAALVVQDVRTGAILAMASVPTYDPNVFVSGITDTQWAELMSHPARPMQNWTLAGYAPGSTYKMGIGLAALETGVIGPSERINCAPVYWRYHKPRNWTPYDQGPADVARALAVSCDPYFYEMGYLLGVDRLAAFVGQFGFGQATGVDLPGEQPGINPTQESYGERWMPGNILSVAIGQGDVLVTPLQLATYTAAVATGGVRYRPYVAAAVRSPAGEVIRERTPEELPPVKATAANWRRIQEGMRLAVTSPEGTAYRPFQGFPVAVAAKTGSAETGEFWSNAVTVAYAPYDKPEIAVSVFVEGGSHGSWVAPAARAVMARYFGITEKHDPGVAIKAD